MKSTLALTLAVSLVWALPATAQAQLAGPQSGPRPGADWSRVRQLALRTELIVTVKGAPPVHGYFVAADDAELLVSDGVVDHIARAEIAEISVVMKLLPRLNRGAKWGVLIGAAAGLVTGVVAMHSYCRTHSCDPVLGTVAYTNVGIILGGGIGVLVSVGLDKSLIYRAP